MSTNNQNKRKIEEKKQEIKRKLKKNISELSIKDREKLQAIALKHDVKSRKVPRVVATGKGIIAEEILKIAQQHDVPLYEDASLASILSKLQLETVIPPALFKMVAEILAFIYYLEKLAERKAKTRDKFRNLR